MPYLHINNIINKADEADLAGRYLSLEVHYG